MRAITMRVLLTAAVAAITVSAAGCSVSAGTPAGDTTPSATAQNLAIGKTLHVTSDALGNAISAFITVESVKFTLSPIADIGLGPKNGVFTVVDMLIQVDAGRFDYNPSYVKYQEPDGTTYDYLSSASGAGFDPSLSYGSLSAGQKTRGNVTFDVKAKGGGVIQLTDAIGTVIGQWTVPAA